MKDPGKDLFGLQVLLLTVTLLVALEATPHVAFSVSLGAGLIVTPVVR